MANHFETNKTAACAITSVAIGTNCNDNGSVTINDDFYTISLNPTGDMLGTSYSVSGVYGASNFVQNNVAYGTTQTLTAQIPIGISTDIVLTDDDDPTCQFTARVVSPSECSTPFDCWAISDEGNPDALFHYDSATNTWSKVGTDTGVRGIESIGYNPLTNVLYTATSDSVGTVDLATGLFMMIPGGMAIGVLQGANGPHDINDIDGMTFDPFTNILWASERREGGTLNDYIFQIDIVTGSHIPNAFGPGVDYVVAPAVFDAVNNQMVYDLDDIAIDPYNGDLYVISNQGGVGGVLTILNKTDGSIKQIIGNFGMVDDMEALGFYNSGNLFGSTGNNSPDPLDLNRFFFINKFDASLTERGAIDVTGVQRDFESCDCLTGAPNTITGEVFHDLNQSGVEDTEDGLEGILVSLIRDVDADSMFTPGVDILLDTTSTDANGQYIFVVASTGDFLTIITEGDLPDNSSLTTDDIESQQFTTVGETNANNDFGYAFVADYGDYLRPDFPPCPEPACHIVDANLRMGATISVDLTNMGDEAAGGDTDDGLIFPNNLHPGTTIQIRTSITNNTGSPAYLYAWADWNADGDFDDAGESFLAEMYGTAGTFEVSNPVAIPSSANYTDGVAMRFRLSTDQASILSPCGPAICAADGEVEDYLIQLICPPTICLPTAVGINRE